MDEPAIDLTALVGAAERSLLVQGLQALRRERVAAWNIASDIAVDRGKPSPPESEFGLHEVTVMLRRVGAGVAFHLIMRIGRQRFQHVARAVNLRMGI